LNRQVYQEEKADQGGVPVPRGDQLDQDCFREYSQEMVIRVITDRKMMIRVLTLYRAEGKEGK